MKKVIEEFLDRISSLSPGLMDARCATDKHWSPNSPPMTIVFSDIGRRIVDDFENVDDITNQKIFYLIEQAMNGSDVELVAAVATGLLEAMVGRAASAPSVWGEIRPGLGKLSGRHADVWLSGR